MNEEHRPQQSCSQRPVFDFFGEKSVYAPGKAATNSQKVRPKNVDARTLGFKCGEYKANVVAEYVRRFRGFAAINTVEEDMTHPAYIIPDLLQPGLKLVFCGSALGTASAQAKAYYAKPGNKFWPTLHAVGLTPRRFAPHEYPLLLKLGIGLTDINKTQSGNDDVLAPEHDDVAGLAAKIETYQPGILAFTAKRPAQVFLRASFGLKTPPAYGLQPQRIGRTHLFVLPSTSGLATSFWDIAPWRELKRLYDGKPPLTN